MTRAEALALLKRRESDIRQLGIRALSIFGSTARGDEKPDSDVDLAASLDPDRPIGLFEFVDMEQQLARMLGKTVDLVTEPSRKPRLQAQIDRDRVRVF
ncbi:nucleotidyltransferase domain-containing protein [Sphingomonas sp. H39-1-10]|uniref:nucleotidyltransferase family protein n=1 Tax=Sphingomonas TaxID=13687 RepID=UPI000B8907B4|nr:MULTISPECIES: nucleotidyltransferase domain-containing protein [Sphingomonas]MDF0489672.1 nucleotidyltransferase domain-containing protein [Sphingomonas pollutisoli]